MKLPSVSENSWQLGYLHCNVYVKQFNHQIGRAELHYYDDTTPWQVFRSAWHPTWQLRGSERIELGLPGFSRNTSPTILPPQHILGQMNIDLIRTSREKLIDLGDLSRLCVAETQWYDHNIRSWCRSPVYHSFQINHMRNVAEWPEGNPNNLVHDLNYEQYKTCWFNSFLWKGRMEFFYTQIRFAHMFREFEEPDWLLEWWETFGLDPINVNPQSW